MAGSSIVGGGEQRASKLVRRRTKKAGLPPGSLVYEGDRKVETVRITLLDYDGSRYEERVLERIEESFPYRDESSITWVNIDGLHDLGLVEKLGAHFGVHPLVLEDIVTAGQRPKMEEYDSHIFFTFRMLTYDEARNEVDSEQVSLLLMKNFVISFQERVGDVFEPVRERIRGQKGRIVKQGADFLAYALLDVVVDNYFSILERVGDRVETMDDRIVRNPDPRALTEVRHLKRELIFLRRSVWPLREVLGRLERTDSALVSDATGIYLRDVYDHTIQVIDSIESLRDMIAGILDIYLSSVSNRLNDVMKVLTIIATIFIPLTFIAGVYGMNFVHMPELKFRWSYPAVWGVMVAVGLSMLFYFKRKRWI